VLSLILTLVASHISLSSSLLCPYSQYDHAGNMQCSSFALLCFATAIARPLALGSHIRANTIAVLALGLHHTPLVLAYSSFFFYWPHISSLYGSSYGSSLISFSYYHSVSYDHSSSYHRPPSDHRTHAGRNQDAPRGHGHNSRNTVHTSTVTRFSFNFSLQGQALGHNDDSRTRHRQRLIVLPCTHLTSRLI
jgi:hypothetical protein